jgi:putative flippase GtrA
MILRKQIIKYVIVGGLAYILEMGALYVFRSMLGLSPVHAVAISFWLGFIAAFALQKIVTFQNYARHPRTLTIQLAGYSALVAWNYLITLLAVKVFANNASVFIIRTIVIIIVTIWNFAIYRYLFHTQINNSDPIHEKSN